MAGDRGLRQSPGGPGPAPEPATWDPALGEVAALEGAELGAGFSRPEIEGAAPLAARWGLSVKGMLTYANLANAIRPSANRSIPPLLNHTVAVVQTLVGILV